MVSRMLDFGLMVYSGRWFWMPIMVSVSMVAALIMMLIRSGLSALIGLEIWS